MKGFVELANVSWCEQSADCQAFSCGSLFKIKEIVWLDISRGSRDRCRREFGCVGFIEQREQTAQWLTLQHRHQSSIYHPFSVTVRVKSFEAWVYFIFYILFHFAHRRVHIALKVYSAADDLGWTSSTHAQYNFFSILYKISEGSNESSFIGHSFGRIEEEK